jgi:glycosyltransferase involved in cell wall biosynthesis
MRVAVEIDKLCEANRSGLFNHLVGFLAGVREAGLARQVTLLVHDKPLAALNVEAVEAMTGFRVEVFRNPRVLWRLRVGASAFGRADVFQVTNCFKFPVLSGRLNAYLVPDLTTVRLPECHTPENRSFWAWMIEQVRQHADLVLTYSEHTRHDVMATLGIPAERVAAVPLAAGAEFRPLPAEAVAAKLRGHGLEAGKYVLTVGTIEPRKNHAALFRAYAALKARGKVAGVPLVVVGGKGWGWEPILAEVGRLGLSDDVRFLGFADGLPELYNGAAVTAYPSRAEGFGLPPLEAMACGCPVVASDATSLPEVVGDAGLLVPPDDVEAIAESIGRVLAEPELRARLSVAGRERAKGFSWRGHAEGVFAAYRRAVAARELAGGVR